MDYKTSIETELKVWEYEKCCGNTQTSVPTAFSSSPKLSRVFHIFSFLLENTATKKKEKQLVYFYYQNVNSRCSRHNYINSSY